MTYDRMSTYLTWGGTIGSTGLDRWQCGVHLALDPSHDGPGLPDQGELNDLLGGALSTFHAAADSWVAPSCFLSWAKAAQLDNAGEYTAEPRYSTVTPVPGGSTAPQRGGPQLSAAITLWSGQTLGRANYGRFYVPWWEAQVDVTGRVVTAQQTAMATNALTLVNAINSWAGTALSATARIRVMSKLGTGATKRAVSLRVGDVKDTQQRRRRQIHETYVGGTIAA